jgi:hypothetical protein
MHNLALWAYHIVHLKNDLGKPLQEPLNRHTRRQLILNVVYQLTRHNLLLVRILTSEHHTKINLKRHCPAPDMPGARIGTSAGPVWGAVLGGTTRRAHLYPHTSPERKFM